MFYLYLSFGKAVFREVTHGLLIVNGAPFNSMYFLSLLAVHELHCRRFSLFISLIGCCFFYLKNHIPGVWFEVKILCRCGLYLFLCLQQPSSFHLLYYFRNNLHNSNFHNFSKSDKNTLSLMGKHLSSYHNEFTIFATRF